MTEFFKPELPKEYQDWDVIEVNHEDCMNWACNNVPLGNNVSL